MCAALAGPATLNLRNFQRLLYRLDGQCWALLHNWDIDDSVGDTLRDTPLGMILAIDLCYGDVDSLLHGALLNALLWDQSHNFFRNVLNRHLRFAVWAQPPKMTTLACQCTGPVGYPLFCVPSESLTPVATSPHGRLQVVGKDLLLTKTHRVPYRRRFFPVKKPPVLDTLPPEMDALSVHFGRFFFRNGTPVKKKTPVLDTLGCPFRALFLFTALFLPKSAKTDPTPQSALKTQ